MWWRCTAADFEAGIRDRGRGNRASLRRLTRDGAVPGLLAYDGERTVGWVSAGPREQFGRILRSPHLRPDAEGHATTPSHEEGRRTWSVVCFYVPRAERGRGIGRSLLDAAVSYATEQGAEVVEGYPVDTGGKSAAAAGIFTGTLDLFLGAGFHQARHRGGKRHVVQLHV